MPRRHDRSRHNETPQDQNQKNQQPKPPAKIKCPRCKGERQDPWYDGKCQQCGGYGHV